MPKTDTTKTWEKIASSQLKGKTVADVRYLNKEEADAMGWFSRPLAIIFDDGSFIYPMADDEGNDGGALATSDDKQPTIPVMR